MAPVASLPVVILLFLGTSKAFLSDELIDYSVSLIEYLATQQVGTFQSVFYDFNDEYPMDGNFDKILKSPRIDHIPKFVINEFFIMSFNSTLPQNPSLVLINLRSQKIQWNTETIIAMFTIINPNTKLLIYTDHRFHKSFDVFIKLLTHPRQFTNMVFIETMDSIVFRVDFEGRIVQGLNLVHPRYSFRNILRNMNGRPIIYSAPGSVSYRDVNWMAATAQFLNATTRYVLNRCPLSESIVLGSCYNEHLFSNNIVISLLFMGLKDLPASLYRMLFDVKPETFLIAVPEPRKVNILEIFVWPFTWESWALLIVVLIVTEFVYIISPRVFRNDPVLLVVCGLERYNLHRASAQEKIFFLPLIIFFFLMLNAYETRIISSMINKPSIGKLRTIQHLIDSGMLLKAHAAKNAKQFEDPKLSKILRDSSNEHELQFDGVNAYFIDSAAMYATLRIASIHDYHSNYYILDETFGLSVGIHWMPHRDGLLETFAKIQRWLFEAGILDKWEKDDLEYIILHYENVNELLNVMGERFSARQQSDILGIHDLLPAWLALGVGLVASFVVLLGERNCKSEWKRN